MPESPGAADADAEPLGPNPSRGVVRIGNTVRRPAGPWTPAVQALLGHLQAAGFDGAPRALGIDGQGREILSFVPGVTPWPNQFDLLESDESLRRVARLTRAFHDAAAGFDPPDGARWQVEVPPDREEIIAHHDLSPWNLVVGAPAWVFVDWEMAAPGSRLWDVAHAINTFVPLSAERRWRGVDMKHRVRVFADAYGLDSQERRRLLPLLSRREMALYDYLGGQAATGVEPWASLWAEGQDVDWRRDADFIADNASQWEQALLERETRGRAGA